jgi:hypothetical protein
VQYGVQCFFLRRVKGGDGAIQIVFFFRTVIHCTNNTPPLHRRVRKIHTIYRRSPVAMVSPRGAEVGDSNRPPPRLGGNTV